MAQDVMIVTEIWNEAFRKISLEAVSQGRKLANELGSSLTAVVLRAGHRRPCHRTGRLRTRIPFSWPMTLVLKPTGPANMKMW